MIRRIYTKIKSFKMILNYFFHSVISTILDVALVWTLLHMTEMSLVLANTAGVIAGFILGFFLNMKRTFATDYSLLSFTLYFSTFLLGLGLADALIVFIHATVIPFTNENLAFVIAKSISIIIPFFILYFIRKYAYQAVNIRKMRKEEK